MTQSRQFLAGISLPLTAENTTQCALLLNNGRIYVLEKKNEADRWNMFSKLTGERPLTREAGNRPKSMNPADQFELEDLSELIAENSYNARIALTSTRNSFEELEPILKKAFISAKEVRDRRIARQQENESLAYKLFKNIFGGGSPEQTSQDPEPSH